MPAVRSPAPLPYDTAGTVVQPMRRNQTRRRRMRARPFHMRSLPRTGSSRSDPERMHSYKGNGHASSHGENPRTPCLSLTRTGAPCHDSRNYSGHIQEPGRPRWRTRDCIGHRAGFPGPGRGVRLPGNVRGGHRRGRGVCHHPESHARDRVTAPGGPGTGKLHNRPNGGPESGPVLPPGMQYSLEGSGPPVSGTSSGTPSGRGGSVVFPAFIESGMYRPGMSPSSGRPFGFPEQGHRMGFSPHRCGETGKKPVAFARSALDGVNLCVSMNRIKGFLVRVSFLSPDRTLPVHAMSFGPPLNRS